MRFVVLAAAPGLIAATACPAMAKDAPALVPSSPWELNYDADSCALRRMFGEGKDQAYVEFRRFAPGLGLQATVASNRMTARNPVKLKYRFGEAGEWRDSGGNALKMVEGFSGVLFAPSLVYLPELEQIEDPGELASYLKSVDWQAAEKSAATAADTITLRGAFRSELRLRLGSLDKPIAALNQCIDELMTHWDIDVEAHKTLTRPVTATNLADVPRMMDYPPKMIEQRMPGVVNIRLAIDEKGLVTACHIQMPLSDPAFEKSSCADLQHALEFDPALDKDGKPIASYWVNKVVFQIAQ